MLYDYKKLLKDFSKGTSRENLKSYWVKDNNVIATNNYILAKIEDNEATENTAGEYPNIDAIINFKDKQIITVDADYLYTIAKFYKDLNKKNKMVKHIDLYIPKSSYEPITFYQNQFKATALIMTINK